MSTSTKEHTLWGLFAIAVLAGVVVATYQVSFERATASRSAGNASPAVATPESSADSTADGATPVVGLVGGCEPYDLHAQNRWTPWGAKIRAAPDSDSPAVGSLQGNELVRVDGWVHGDVPYPHNSPPWNSDIWFHLADDSGWVSFAAVRELPTSRDRTSLDPYGGEPAPTPTDCQGAKG